MTGTRLACGAGGVVLTLATLGAAAGPTMRAVDPAPAATAVAAPSIPAPAPRPTPASEPAYAYPIPDAQWARITATGTWRPGCPVGREGLTNVSVPFFGMDGTYHRGTITVNKDVAPDIIHAFNSLASHRFPIRQVVPIENYGGTTCGGNFVEVFCDTPLDVCERRDVKGLYAKARSAVAEGKPMGFTGVDDPYEAPLDPEVTLDTSKLSVSECADRIIEKLLELGYIQPHGHR